MAARPGRSGGANKIPIETHLLRGTFRPERHSRLLPPGPPWKPASGQLEALSAAGRGLVDRVWTAYVLSQIEGEILLEAAQVVDRLEHLRSLHRNGLILEERLKLDRVEQGWLRQLGALLLALRVDR